MMMVTAGLHREHVEDVCMSVRGMDAWACASMLKADKLAVRGKGYVGYP